MPFYRYECEQCNHEDLLFWTMADEKAPQMCPRCWGQFVRVPSKRIMGHTFQDYMLDTPDGKRVHVKSAAMDRDIPAMYGICKATSDEIGCVKRKPIKPERSFAEDYARHAALTVGKI